MRELGVYKLYKCNKVFTQTVSLDPTFELILRNVVITKYGTAREYFGDYVLYVDPFQQAISW